MIYKKNPTLFRAPYVYLYWDSIELLYLAFAYEAKKNCKERRKEKNSIPSTFNFYLDLIIILFPLVEMCTACM